MAEWRRISTARQLAAYLRGELERGRWSGKMPGVMRLASELGVARDSMEDALRELEREGVLRGRGKGQGRIIDLEGGGAGTQGMRVAILLYERNDKGTAPILDTLRMLEEAGHKVAIAAKTLVDLGMDVKRVARMVEDIDADAWIVLAGSREVLEWFVGHPVPAFAFAGRHRTLLMAAATPDKLPAYGDAVSRLAALGHRRIVLLVRTQHRLPVPSALARTFLEELESHGLPVGPYNLPNWKDSAEGLQSCLDSLFTLTPPTALLIDEPFLFVAAQQHLAHRGILSPDRVSLICTDPDPAFAWCRPTIAHMRWDTGPVVRRIVRWVNNIHSGKEDLRKTYTKARFVEGGTIGPVRER